jgi:predicted nuclease of predicted toxin-antitoxin system
LRLNLLADEDVNFNIIRELRKHSFEITSILEDYRSALDEEVLKISEDTESILITEDKDFGEWVFAHKVKVNGVIFLRYDPRDLIKISESLIKVLSSYGTKLYGKFVVITPKKIRIREII